MTSLAPADGVRFDRAVSAIQPAEATMMRKPAPAMAQDRVKIDELLGYLLPKLA